MEKCKLFVVFHHELNKEYYKNSLLSQYVFVNVNPKNNAISNYPEYNIVNQFELKDFRSLGKWYTESEVIYNVYKNKYLYEELDYIGFSQYDIDSSILNDKVLASALNGGDHINFEPHLFQIDYDQKILMDVTQPGKLTGEGVNCYDEILTDYNKYYGTGHSVKDLHGKTINLCSAFILKKDAFVKMMQFISSIIESGKLDQFDTAHQHRIQGGYLERYYAVWIALERLSSVTIKLPHLYAETSNQNSLLNRILRKLRVR